jgi:hypothetical protein
LLDIRTVTPPGIAFILAFALVYSGLSMNNPAMVLAGWVFLVVGIFLQIAYLLLRNWKPRVPTGRQPGRVHSVLFRLLVSNSPLALGDQTFDDGEFIPYYSES